MRRQGLRRLSARVGLRAQRVALHAWREYVTGRRLGLPAAQTMGVSDLFLRKDLGTHVGHYTGCVDIDGGLMLRLSGPKQTASASPLAITEGVPGDRARARARKVPPFFQATTCGARPQAVLTYALLRGCRSISP